MGCNSNPCSKSCFECLLQSVKIKNHPLKFSNKDKKCLSNPAIQDQWLQLLSPDNLQEVCPLKYYFCVFLTSDLEKTLCLFAGMNVLVCVCCNSAFLSKVIVSNNCLLCFAVVQAKHKNVLLHLSMCCAVFSAVYFIGSNRESIELVEWGALDPYVLLSP